MTITRVHLEPQSVAGVREVVPMGALAAFFARAFATTAEELGRHGITPAGAAVALYRGLVAETVDVLAGYPLAHPWDLGSALAAATLRGGDAVMAIHRGPYDTLSATYDELTGWFSEHGLTPAPEMWEEYLLGPGMAEDPHSWKTRVVFPVA